MRIWEAKREAGASVLIGFCDAGIGVAKLGKELRRMPSPASESYSFFVERLARRVCPDDWIIRPFHFDVVGGELVPRVPPSETRH